ncbi:ankyrin repeat domain-containing protein [Anaplasma capra]|uniref:ankyrin repeat domain-containing protein n=1 Tax=Anaplasma capra TaxID=1562740 RepID=UPI0021D5DAD5|nr:ankyrin repeat domain-containing protein [Anaplasma capra]MCU7611903.1 ankyrin repeat domain-containing protein [Anaplasma capra]MCU7612762.1 ankyrin repeat domain-containing protein [Anaplasma capra]
MFFSRGGAASDALRSTVALMEKIGEQTKIIVPNVESGPGGVITRYRGSDDREYAKNAPKKAGGLSAARGDSSSEKQTKSEADLATEENAAGDAVVVGSETSAESVQAGDQAGPAADNTKNALRSRSWPYRRAVHPYIEITGTYNDNNSHLPRFYDAREYYAHVFYCAKSNNITGLMALVNELENLGKDLKFVLEGVRTKSGDNVLIYAIRHGAIDTVRYLLSNGANVMIKNNKGETPLSVAVASGRADMINAVSEMQVGLSASEG